ncbi:MAG: IS21 family transposase [Haloechinothrix sp.]
MNIRRFRALFDAGASYAEIAAECGCDWRTVKKYLAPEAASAPPGGSPRAGTQPKVIAPFTEVIDAWLRTNIKLRGTVIHERLVAEYGYRHSYQRVKMYLQEARPRIVAELAEGDENPLHGLHRRFEVVPGAQGQVDWGEEGSLLAHVGVGKVYSFHMTLSHSRDPFCCFTDSTDLATFWDCHRRAFAHFGGVPHTIVYDRTKTVVKRHVAPRQAVPLHPEAAAFADHYGFVCDVLAAYRPMGKGRVERQVEIARAHVIAGREFDSLTDMDQAFVGWLPIRRAQVHRTHGEVIAVRAERDRAALLPLPPTPYVVAEQHLRTVGKDCLVSYEASLYSVPAVKVRPHQRVQVRATGESVAIHALDADGGAVLAVHPRAPRKGSWMVEQAHWDGLADGHTRATTRDDDDPLGPPTAAPVDSDGEPNPLSALLARNTAAQVPVARRDLASYDAAARLTGHDDGPEVTLW